MPKLKNNLFISWLPKGLWDHSNISSTRIITISAQNEFVETMRDNELFSIKILIRSDYRKNQ